MPLSLLLLLSFSRPTFAAKATATPAKATATPAKEEDQTFEVFTQKKPFQITGHLSPFRFLVDGRLLFERPRSFVTLKVNNIDVKKTDENQRFFQFETDANSLVIEASTWKKNQDRFNLKPGHLISAKWMDKKFIFFLAGEISQARIDGNAIPIKEKRIEWDPGGKAQGSHRLTLVGEGTVPDVEIVFLLATPVEHTTLIASKQSAERSNKNRLIASEKEIKREKFQWRFAQVELGLKFQNSSNVGFGFLLAPLYTLNERVGIRGLLGLAVFSTVAGFQWGPEIGIHFTTLLPKSSVVLEAGPSLYLFNQGVGGVLALTIATSYKVASSVDFFDYVGLSYSRWLTPSANVLKFFVGTRL